MTGGEAMVRAAAANGMDTMFGLPGVQTYPLFDAVCQDPNIREVISRHEQGAGYMALGYAHRGDHEACVKTCKKIEVHPEAENGLRDQAHALAKHVGN